MSLLMPCGAVFLYYVVRLLSAPLETCVGMSGSDLQLVMPLCFGFLHCREFLGLVKWLWVQDWLLGSVEEWHLAPQDGLLALMEHLDAYQGITDTLTLNPSSSCAGLRAAYLSFFHCTLCVAIIGADLCLVAAGVI